MSKETIQEAIQEAVEYLLAEEDKLGLVLDGSALSLEGVEALFDEDGDTPGALPSDPDERAKLLFAIGAYVGQVVIEESGGAARWVPGDADPDDPWAAYLEGTEADYQAYPMAKVVKRDENGAEESLVSFATVAIGLFSGQFGVDGSDD